jgi:hypothetical protein
MCRTCTGKSKSTSGAFSRARVHHAARRRGGRPYNACTANVETGLGASTDNTVVFWDTDADGDADEAIALVNTPQALLDAGDII